MKTPATTATPTPPPPPACNMVQNMQDMMRSVQLALNVTKLTSTNYTKWKRNIEVRLQSAGVWSVITDTPPVPATNEYVQRNFATLHDIYSSCERDQQDLIMDYTTAQSSWDLLRTRYENRSATNVNRL